MDPLPLASALPIDLATLLATVAPKEAQLRAALLALVGQELDVLFEASVPEGVKLRLPQGQILVAQGSLPFPEGTVLRVQVLPPPAGETAPRLQTLAAQLPPPPPVLAPLVLGEALPLLLKLQAPDPPVPLKALASLFHYLDGLEPRPSLPEPVALRDTPNALPEVPAALREPLGRALAQLLPPETPEQHLTRWLNEAGPAFPGKPSPQTAAPSPQSAPTPVGPAALPALILQDPTLPPQVREALTLLVQTGRTPASLPPPLHKAVAEALAQRLPPPPLEARLQRWVAWVAQGGTTPPAPAARVAVPQPPHAKPGEPTLRLPPLPASQAALSDWWGQVPPEVREALEPLVHPPDPRPGPPASPGPTSLVRGLNTLPAEAFQAVARTLGVPTHLPPAELAQALREAGRTFPAIAQLIRDGLPEPLARALTEVWLADGVTLPERGSLERLERRVSTWPEPLRLALAQALNQALPMAPPAPSLQGLAPSSHPRDLAEALLRWVQTLEPAPAEKMPTSDPASLAMTLKTPTQRNLPPEAEKLLNHSALPLALKEPARTWLRALLNPGPAPEAAAKPQAAPPESTAAPSLKELPLNAQAKAGLEARLALGTPDALAHAEPWAGWVEASLRTLSNPQASPREAPFHALQALDGTAYFEIPLPGRASGPLQLWVEKDASPESPDVAPVHKILLGLRFTALGETRVGLLQTAGALSVRVWAEHPDPLRGGEEALKTSLEALGERVSLRIAPLPKGSPTPRSLAVGPGYQGLA